MDVGINSNMTAGVFKQNFLIAELASFHYFTILKILTLCLLICCLAFSLYVNFKLKMAVICLVISYSLLL